MMITHGNSLSINKPQSNIGTFNENVFKLLLCYFKTFLIPITFAGKL